MYSPSPLTGIPYMSNWKAALDNPFANTTPHIPDDHTLLSGRVRTHTVFTFTPSNQNGATSDVHSSGLIIRPRPLLHVIRCAQTAPGSAIVRDIAASGNSLDASANANAAAGIYPYGGSAMVRCVAMGVSVVYQGTELNRAGRYTAGLLPVTLPSKCAGAGSALSSLSTMVPTDSNVNVSLDTIRTSMQLQHTQRISDEPLVLTWRPGGVPGYQRVHNDTTYTQVGGGESVECEYINNPGQSGQAPGEMNLMLLVENDYVGTASASGNAYQVTIDAHWEAIPSSQFDVVYSLSPSPYIPSAIVAALNSIDKGSVLFRPSFRGAPRQKRKGMAQTVVQTRTARAQPTPTARIPVATSLTRNQKAKQLQAAALIAGSGILGGAIGNAVVRGARRIHDEL